MSRRTSFVVLLAIGFGLYAADVGIVSQVVEGGEGLFVRGGIDEPIEGASSPVTPKHLPSPALAGWELDREELSFPLASRDGLVRPSLFGRGSRLGRAPPLV